MAITTLMVAVLTAHAALGSSVHQPCSEYQDHEPHAGHIGHMHGADAGPTGDDQAPPKCEEQCCVYVLPRADVYYPSDHLSLVAPLLTLQLHKPASVSGHIPAPVEAVTHLLGPSLHVWQCVWVI